MNEAETRAELIDPQLKESGWGTGGFKILREHYISPGRIHAYGIRGKPEKADYILVLNNKKVAVIEAKAIGQDTEKEGVAQAKEYALKLDLEFTYATNGEKIYEINMLTGKERYIDRFPTPQELENAIQTKQNEWKQRFDEIPYEDVHGNKGLRYYQEIAVSRSLNAIAENKQRILLTLATGTGKTFIAFQIAWKLFHTRWNVQKDSNRRPRILFLADRNILADQAFNAFNRFPEDALVRIKPADIRKKGYVPTNGSIFFTIFQTFTSGPDKTPYYGDYPPDFFDCIIIDECHRGGAEDESEWRSILEYFDSAVQIGLTATPKRKDNVDTYRYFGEPLYTYSLKSGIEDGFLTPFRVERIQTTIDDYVYTKDDDVLEGEVEEGKLYEEKDFNRIIEIQEREEKRVQILLSYIKPLEKTLVFCANQAHAALIRDLINQNKMVSDPFYCVRVTANDGAQGDQYLEEFKDNERTIPTILTTSQKLSTGVDALNVRNIVLLRPVESMIEFKQIIGRGTRLYDGKDYFTIYDFVGASKNFSDPEWDGEPLDKTTTPKAHEGSDDSPEVTSDPIDETGKVNDLPSKVKIKLRSGKIREVQHTKATSFWTADGKPLSVQEFVDRLYGDLREHFNTEKELTKIWSEPKLRGELLNKLSNNGYSKDILEKVQEALSMQQSDLYDVFSFIAFEKEPQYRADRVETASSFIMKELSKQEKEFINFVLEQYIRCGIEELAEEKLPHLLTIKYKSIFDAERELGDLDKIKRLFLGFQKYLYIDSNL